MGLPQFIYVLMDNFKDASLFCKMILMDSKYIESIKHEDGTMTDS